MCVQVAFALFVFILILFLSLFFFFFLTLHLLIDISIYDLYRINNNAFLYRYTHCDTYIEYYI